MPIMSDISKGKRALEDGGKTRRVRKRSRFAPVEANSVPDRNSLKRPREAEPSQGIGPGRESWQSSVSNHSLEKRPRSYDVTAIPVAPVATIRINRNKAMEKRIKGTLKVSENDLIDEDPSTNPYFDPSIAIKTETRRPVKPNFKFVEQGKITARAEKLRDRAEEEAITEAYREKIAARAAENSAVPELPPYIENRQPYAESKKFPNVEWWDAPFLAGDAYVGGRLGNSASDAKEEASTEAKSGKADADAKDNPMMAVQESDIALDESKITVFVHHPKKIVSSIPEKPPPVLPLMLTQKERKRLRRQRRQDKIREEQEMIAVGLLPVPPPKVKLSNMMRVLAEEASADPTKMEMEVRKQVEARRLKHENDNNMRRRTKEEKRDKIKEMEENDRAAGLAAAVYRVTSAENPQHRYKVVTNARQLGLTGSFVIFDDCNVVVVEGGTKSLQKFKKLMLRRIDWTVITPPNADPSGDAEKVDVESRASSRRPPRKHECVLVWEGAIGKQGFQEFKTVNIWSENGCRLYFRKRRVEQYWDLCIQASPPGDTTLGVRSVD